MSAKVLLCKECGRLFQSMGASYCPECVDNLDKAFITVKEYIYENENATLVDIVDNTGVPEKHVLYFLKEGRLNIDNTDEALNCEDCGRPIPNGRYCSNCREKLANAFSSVSAVAKTPIKPDVKVSAKMHSRYGRDKNN